MKRFGCPSCGNEVFFDSRACLACGRRLGYLPERFEMATLQPDGSLLAANGPVGPARFCRNAETAGCNWTVPATEPTGYCTACRHNRTIPDIAMPGNQQRWTEIELAKRKLFYSLMRWDLPMPTVSENPQDGLAFDFLAEARNFDGSMTRVLTGHENGLITLNIAEGDDATREYRRTEMGESYRTLIGHMRHEVGHYYWDRLVRDGGQLEACRAVFGDERQDYGQALERHYTNGAPPDWPYAFISAYAASHPWEDFAETWAHWTHIIDGLETARSYGVTITGDLSGRAAPVSINFDPYAITSADWVAQVWVPMTIAINSVNRSMGQPDLYPFVLSAPVLRKLEFINTLIHQG